ncbi:MAG: hypothetical protein ACR2H1_02275 [Limisphaerales bacterium]
MKIQLVAAHVCDLCKQILDFFWRCHCFPAFVKTVVDKSNAFWSPTGVLLRQLRLAGRLAICEKIP